MILPWSAIEGLYVGSCELHWQRAQAQGLDCPIDVFEQLFWEHYGDADFARDLHDVDWFQIEWREESFSGVTLRHQIAIPRGYEHAVHEARSRTATLGLEDDREEIVAHWREAQSWLRKPVALSGELLGSNLRYQWRVGFTRLGNALGLLDRQELPEWSVHRVWVGRRVISFTTPGDTI